MKYRTIIVASLALALLFASTPAWAQLSPVGWGFPNIVHSLSSTAFVQDLADATSFHDVSIGFGGGLPCGPVGVAFPSIHETSLETQSMSHTEFSQTNEFTSIGYPYVSVGGANPFGGFMCY